MEQEQKEIEVCNRSLDLARQHKDSGNYLRAFAHYLVHKNIFWGLREANKKLQATADVSEIYFTFEKVKICFERKLHIGVDGAILAQWKATNEQFTELLDRTLKEVSFENDVHSNREKLEYVSDLLLNHSTEHAMNLFKMGEYLDACETFDTLLGHPMILHSPKMLLAKENKHRIANIAVDRWHFTMLNDHVRNEHFRSALNEVLQTFNKESSVKILDIGTGSGLLALYAQDAAARAKVNSLVIACEASLPMASIAKRVFNGNSISKAINGVERTNFVGDNEIRLIPKLSTHITSKEILKESIDVLVTETFDAGLLGEHVLETLDHAFKNFLSKNCTIIPCRASVYIAVIECQAVIEKMRIVNKEIGILTLDGVDIVAAEIVNEPYTSERLTTLPGGFKFLSNECGEKLIDINFENAYQVQEYLSNGRTFQRRIQCCLNKDATEVQLHAVVLWFELHLLDKNKFKKELTINTKPRISGQNSEEHCWEQAIFPIITPLSVRNGDEVEIKINLKGHFSLESCEKVKMNDGKHDIAAKPHVTLKLPSNTLVQINDRYLQNSYQRLAENITSSITNHEKWNPKKRIDILDLTETCLISLQLLKLNTLNNVTVAHIETDNDQEDISTTPFAMRIQYVCEVALNNKLKVNNIDCVTSLEKAPDHSYDLVLIDLVEPCGKLNREYLEKIPLVRNKLRLANPDSILSPFKLRVYCQLIHSDKLNKMVYVDDKNAHGFDISSTFNKLSVNHLQDIDIHQLLSSSNKDRSNSMDLLEGKVLSDPFEVYSIDLMSFSASDNVKKDIEIVISHSGTAQGIAYWFSQDYGWDVNVSSYCFPNFGEDKMFSHYKQACITFHSPLSVVRGEKTKLAFLYSNGLIDFIQSTKE